MISIGSGGRCRCTTLQRKIGTTDEKAITTIRRASRPDSRARNNHGRNNDAPIRRTRTRRLCVARKDGVNKLQCQRAPLLPPPPPPPPPSPSPPPRPRSSHAVVTLPRYDSPTITSTADAAASATAQRSDGGTPDVQFCRTTTVRVPTCI